MLGIFRCALVMGVIVALSACATRYGDMGLMGGVESTPLAADTEMIAARGNGFTDPSRVQQFVLLKSAQDCLAAGYTKFAFISAQDTTRRMNWVNPAQTSSYSTVTGYGNMATVTTNSYTTPETVTPIIKPGETVVVKFFKADDPASKNSLDAALIAANLGPRLEH